MISKYVNMPIGMKRIIDPDALLLQGAADPTRLAILRQLSGGDEICACDFTACCDVAQPTVSHHLRVLREAGLVTVRRDAQRRWYELRPEPLAAMDEWLTPYRWMWEDRLDALERHLDAMPDDPTDSDRPAGEDDDR